jgi:hypothetical protein
MSLEALGPIQSASSAHEKTASTVGRPPSRYNFVGWVFVSIGIVFSEAARGFRSVLKGIKEGLSCCIQSRKVGNNAKIATVAEDAKIAQKNIKSLPKSIQEELARFVEDKQFFNETAYLLQHILISLHGKSPTQSEPVKIESFEDFDFSESATLANKKQAFNVVNFLRTHGCQISFVDDPNNGFEIHIYKISDTVKGFSDALFAPKKTVRFSIPENPVKLDSGISVRKDLLSGSTPPTPEPEIK